MDMICAFVIGVMLGSFISLFIAGASLRSHEEEAYKRGLKDGRLNRIRIEGIE